MRVRSGMVVRSEHNDATGFRGGKPVASVLSRKFYSMEIADLFPSRVVPTRLKATAYALVAPSA